MTLTRLLAKSSRDPNAPLDGETLAGHLGHVGAVASMLAHERGRSILDALGLEAETWHAPLIEASVRAALLHDIGKANDHFQQMVRGERRLPQAFKHEVVGLWMLANLGLDEWVFAGQPELVRSATLRALIGHHVRFDGVSGLEPAQSGDLSVRVHAGHPDFRAALDLIASRLAIGCAPATPDRALDVLDGMASAQSIVLNLSRAWRKGNEEARFAAAVAALVVSADVAGSVVARSGNAPVEWSRHAVQIACDGDDLASVAARGYGGHPPRAFQASVGHSEARMTLTTAGCGTGKSAAAYAWASRRLRGRKLFFCYPTTGTATEGYLDYALPELNDLAVLVHSRASYDIERILDNGRASEDGPWSHALLGYQGLAMWGAKATVCTADAVLGLTQNARLGLFGFPAIAGAGFVFDEIHLYDDRMFGSLLAFLEAMRGAPTLLMTATLQHARLAALRELAERVGETLAEITGPPELEQMQRYAAFRAAADEAWTRVDRELDAGGRVLWVANTVERAVAVARQAHDRGLAVEPYHSRYRYKDRVDRHRAVVDRFRSGSRHGGLAVTTQVCEVSLDISATMLVTELAPPSSLIQRFGRLNRWATPDDCVPRPAYVLEPPAALPYTADDLDAGRRWLALVAGHDVSQADLHAALPASMPARATATRTPSEWLDEAWGVRASLREAGATLTIVRAEDVPPGPPPDSPAIVALSIPMLAGPVAREVGSWQEIRGVLVAPAGRVEYSDRWGATWRK